MVNKKVNNKFYLKNKKAEIHWVVKILLLVGFSALLLFSLYIFLGKIGVR